MKKTWLPDPALWKGTWRNDWRIMGQEGYLKGKILQYRVFDRAICREDYCQCEFCWDTFESEAGSSTFAYFEPSGKFWICDTCYRDFEQHFGWIVEKN